MKLDLVSHPLCVIFTAAGTPAGASFETMCTSAVDKEPETNSLNRKQASDKHPKKTTNQQHSNPGLCSMPRLFSIKSMVKPKGQTWRLCAEATCHLFHSSQSIQIWKIQSSPSPVTVFAFSKGLLLWAKLCNCLFGVLRCWRGLLELHWLWLQQLLRHRLRLWPRRRWAALQLLFLLLNPPNSANSANSAWDFTDSLWVPPNLTKFDLLRPITCVKQQFLMMMQQQSFLLLSNCHYADYACCQHVAMMKGVKRCRPSTRALETWCNQVQESWALFSLAWPYHILSKCSRLSAARSSTRHRVNFVALGFGELYTGTKD